MDLGPDDADLSMLADAVTFLRKLVAFVPGADDDPPEVHRLRAFLDQVERQAGGWRRPGRGGRVRRQLVFTLPPIPGGSAEGGLSSLEHAVTACRKRGGAPAEAWVASPFFDDDDDTDDSRVTAALCKRLGRGKTRDVTFCVPALRDGSPGATPRLMAPRSLVRTAEKYQARVRVEMLPPVDDDKNARPWHAKMLTLRSEAYSALMIRSSNFTCAGMGVTPHRHAEANLLTLVDRVASGRESGRLEAIWPEMEMVTDPDAAEWLGAKPEEEDEQATATALPQDFCPLPIGPEKFDRSSCASTRHTCQQTGRCMPAGGRTGAVDRRDVAGRGPTTRDRGRLGCGAATGPAARAMGRG